MFHTGTKARRGKAAEIATFARQIAAVLPDRMRDLATQPYGTWRDILTTWHGPLATHVSFSSSTNSRN